VKFSHTLDNENKETFDVFNSFYRKRSKIIATTGKVWKRESKEKQN